MGNNSSQRRSKRACKDKGMDKAEHKQPFCHFHSKKPGLDRRHHTAEEAAAGPRVRIREDAPGRSVGSTAPASMLQGAGDGTGRREGARAREMKKILVLLLLLDARQQEQGRHTGGLPGAKARPSTPRRGASMPACNQESKERNPGEEWPCKRRRCPRPRP
ncbi:uncharacterized protein C20orf144 homolog isoform X2 [Ochotona princeps]|uniref:uncharacterized protein C20orf144 homolog isoform X2 n=1 Tax=Ochotona princeps TaxID=9978 RepID=UPI002714EFD3|nr:uncharacterized protein C20orf144 homolog isoform X2 [Ochotona princeps]